MPDIESVEQFVHNKKGRFSVGGMVSKLQAVKAAVDAGIPTSIANGRRAGQLAAIVAGKHTGTRFIAKGEKFAKVENRS